VVSHRLSVRLGSDRRLVFLCLLATSLIVAVTWPLGTLKSVQHIRETFHPGAVFSWWREQWGTRTYTLFAKVDGRRNVALFMPAGFLWTLLIARREVSRPAWRVIGALCGLSFDLVTNTVGSAIGALVATVWIALRRRLRSRPLDANSG
jgi:glycopeptide antibiotics resistance protein